MADTSTPPPNIKPYLIIALLGGVVAYQSWKAGEALGDSLTFKLGVLFALGGLLIALNGIRRARASRTPALPAAPAEFNGCFAPDFRRNLAKLYEALGTGNPEMTLEEDYAFWYNQEQSIELVLTGNGWMAFYLLTDGEYHMEASLGAACCGRLSLCRPPGCKGTGAEILRTSREWHRLVYWGQNASLPLHQY